MQDVIRGPKTNITVGDWGSGKMPKAHFPLSKAGKKAWSFGPAWRWRFAKFSCGGRDFVIRLLFNPDKMKVHAHLAVRCDRDLTVLCSYEYHADFVTGWHLHTLCGEKNDIDTAPCGTLVHGPWVKRIPAARSHHNDTEFGNDMAGGLDSWLWRRTMRFFRVEEKGELM